MQHTKLKLTIRNPRNVMPMAITHLMNITSSQTVYVLYVAVVCTIWRLVCCVLWLHPSLCCPTAFKGVAKLHGDIFEACVPSPLKYVCFHLNESPAIQRFECGDASKIWWNNRFLHWTVTHLCMYIHSLAHSISKVYNWQTSVLHIDGQRVDRVST